MTPKQFYYAYPKAHLIDVAKRAGTNLSNFQQIAIAGGSVSKTLAEKLAKSSDGEMSELEILYPERFEQQAVNQ
jgi:Mg-chelatase subunit ChlD